MKRPKFRFRGETLLRIAPIWMFILAVAMLLVDTAPPTSAGPQKKQQTNSRQTTTCTGGAAVCGKWTAPVETPGIVAIHMAMLPNSQVLMFFYDNPPGSGGSPAILYNPATGTTTQVNVPIVRNIFCAGMNFMPDGRLLVSGGHNDAGGGYGFDGGINAASIFNPFTNTWVSATNMNDARWYPTDVPMPDGTSLVLSGINSNGTALQLQMESYNESTNTWTLLPSSANIPSNTNVYPRVVSLPDGKVFIAAWVQNTQLFDPSTNTWTAVGTTNFGTRAQGSVVLLPGPAPGKVLSMGGSLILGGVATNTMELIDFSQSNPNWCWSGTGGTQCNPAIPSMNFARINGNAILLPNGTVLMIGGGGGNGKYANPVFTPEVYDPVANTWTELADEAVQRTYHSTAVLMPDGRVIVAGSDSGSQQDTFEIFSPPYLAPSKGPRPTITSAPTSLGYNQQFTITTPQAASIVRVALIRLDSTTHATHFDQRFVDLTWTVGSGQLNVTAPVNSNVAPPGYYMIDILGSDGVPAIMPLVLLN